MSERSGTILKWTSLAIGAALLALLLVAMVVSAVSRSSAALDLQVPCTGGTRELPCRLRSARIQVPDTYGKAAAPARTVTPGCIVRLRLTLRPAYRAGRAPAPRAVPGGLATTSRFADGRTLTRITRRSPRAAPSLTLTIPEDGVVHELRGVPDAAEGCSAPAAVRAHASGADDLERAFSDTLTKAAKGTNDSQNGLLPSSPVP